MWEKNTCCVSCSHTSFVLTSCHVAFWQTHTCFAAPEIPKLKLSCQITASAQHSLPCHACDAPCLSPHSQAAACHSCLLYNLHLPRSVVQHICPEPLNMPHICSVALLLMVSVTWRWWSVVHKLKKGPHLGWLWQCFVCINEMPQCWKQRKTSVKRHPADDGSWNAPFHFLEPGNWKVFAKTACISFCAVYITSLRLLRLTYTTV